ncbi:hypothetical protein C8Q73DRAFT_341514 [Cubamyces lactineus]|nr:hypothetical protein C8Q73DRAFT_341514 [Cubamyces lactineus]
MSSRGRSLSPRPLRDEDVDMDRSPPHNPHAKVVIVTNLTRNVAETHLQTIFGFYGELLKVDLPLFGKSGQNKGKASLEYADAASAQKAVAHMDGGQIDGAVVKCELSEVPVRSRSYTPSRSRSPRPPPRGRYGRGKSYSRSPSRSRSPPPRGGRRGYEPRYNDNYRRLPPGRRPPPPPRDSYRRFGRTPSRSRSPPRRGGDRLPPRRRSPSYERGGTGYRGRSRSYSVASSRSRTPRSLTPRSRSRSSGRSRSRSYYSSSGYSRSRSPRSRSPSRARRSYSRDDIRDSRSRSPRD